MAPTKKQHHRLRVSVGPSTDPKDLKPIAVNDDANPVWIESDEFVGQIVIRLRGFDKSAGYEEGAKEDNLKTVPESAWFQNPSGANHLSSIQIHGRFKREWAGDQILFGDQFERPLRPPPFTSAIMKFMHLLNPTLEADLTCPRPFAFCPLIATMNTVKVSESPNDKSVSTDLPPWPSKAGDHIREDTTLLFMPKDDDSRYASIDDKKRTPAMTSSERRSYFAKPANLKNHTLRPNHIYDFDFFNQFLDFPGFKVKIPGLSVDLSRPLDGQPLLFVAKSKDNSAVFFAIRFELVPVDEASK